MSRPPITRARPWTASSGAFAGQTFTSERQYRNALARLHGYRSWAVQQAAAGPPVRGRRDALRLRPSELEAHQRVGSALSEMHRNPSLSRAEAARRAHTTPAAMRRHAASALVKTTSGRYRATSTDTHYRRLNMITTEGLVAVDTRSSRDAAAIAAHDAAVDWALRTGDDSRLPPFRERHVRAGGRNYRFLVDMDMLEELGARGEISFESIYEAP